MKSYFRNTTLLIAVMFTFVFIIETPQLFAHGDATGIVPETLSVKAGSELKVFVEGLTETNKAAFELKGMFGKYNLGEYPVSKDDFEQTLKIPENVPPGTYSLIVSGGEKEAKAVITVN